MRSQLPLRWFDVNQVDGDVAELLRQGVSVYQNIIPLSGGSPMSMGVIDYPRQDRCEYCGLRLLYDGVRCVGCGAPL